MPENTATKIVQCTQCGAGLTSRTRSSTSEHTCEYCGSITRKKSLPEQAREQGLYISPGHCPRCHRKTVETQAMGCRLRACHHCGGVWLPIVALRQIGRMRPAEYRELFELNRSKLQRRSKAAKARHGELRCPACAVAMTQYTYAKGRSIAVDVCRKHGVWFDQSELALTHRDVARQLGLRVGRSRKRTVDLGLDVTWAEKEFLLAAVIVVVGIVAKLLK